jgi:hypothetical protein
MLSAEHANPDREVAFPGVPRNSSPVPAGILLLSQAVSPNQWLTDRLAGTMASASVGARRLIV